ncbi:hypothetical protein O3Q51_06660 [Cryomorphaceae bacterium 1068]|nr:hypothetical protein [Cryomorphaceae bacterium 1068]
MYRLSFIIVLLLVYVGSASAQNPHGEGMILECKDCHATPENYGFLVVLIVIQPAQISLNENE